MTRSMTRLLTVSGLMLACFALFLKGGDAPAQLTSIQQTAVIPASQEQVRLSYAPVVKKAAPAVVNIYTKQKVQVQSPLAPFMNDPLFQQFFGNGFGGMTRERIVSSLGSGVIIQADGTIVTNVHVVKNADDIRVVLSDRREFPAKILMADDQTDLALLKIDAHGQNLPVLEIADSDALEVGDLVLAIGNPFGVGQTVTSGIISALARSVDISDYQYFIQTDAAINPGNSGGALVDMNGRLIGINSAIYSTSGTSAGIGFAIPASMVKALQAGQMKDGKIVKAWLGVTVQPVTAELAESLSLDRPEGVIVKQVYPNSAAATAGLQEGDVILSINNKMVDDAQALNFHTATAPVGSQAELEILRQAKKMRVMVTLSPAPELPTDQRTLKGRHPLNGLTVANLTPAAAQQLDLSPNATGVVVVDSPDNSGYGFGLMQGDIILQVNGVKITSTSQLEKLMADRVAGWKISYLRNGQVTTLMVTS